MTYVRRDGLARCETHRRLVPKDGRRECSWCGSREGRFEYRTEHDGGRVSIHVGRFCSKECHDSYHHP